MWRDVHMHSNKGGMSKPWRLAKGLMAPAGGGALPVRRMYGWRDLLVEYVASQPLEVCWPHGRENQFLMDFARAHDLAADPGFDPRGDPNQREACVAAWAKALAQFEFPVGFTSCRTGARLSVLVLVKNYMVSGGCFHFARMVHWVLQRVEADGDRGAAFADLLVDVVWLQCTGHLEWEVQANPALMYRTQWGGGAWGADPRPPSPRFRIVDVQTCITRLSLELFQGLVADTTLPDFASVSAGGTGRVEEALKFNMACVRAGVRWYLEGHDLVPPGSPAPSASSSTQTGAPGGTPGAGGAGAGAGSAAAADSGVGGVIYDVFHGVAAHGAYDVGYPWPAAAGFSDDTDVAIVTGSLQSARLSE
jgi:hypothetical protein